MRNLFIFSKAILSHWDLWCFLFFRRYFETLQAKKVVFNLKLIKTLKIFTLRERWQSLKLLFDVLNVSFDTAHKLADVVNVSFCDLACRLSFVLPVWRRLGVTI